MQLNHNDVLLLGVKLLILKYKINPDVCQLSHHLCRPSGQAATQSTACMKCGWQAGLGSNTYLYTNILCICIRKSQKGIYLYFICI